MLYSLLDPEGKNQERDSIELHHCFGPYSEQERGEGVWLKDDEDSNQQKQRLNISDHTKHLSSTFPT